MTSFTSKLPPGVRRLLRLPLTRRRLLRDMDDELAAHIAMRVDELRALGLSESDAEAEAVRRFGDTDEFKEYIARRAGRRARRLGVLQWSAEFAQDGRAAFRQLRRTPVLSAVVVVTLAVTIGATTAVYGVVRQLLLAPLPYPDANRIVSLEVRKNGDGNFRWDVSGEFYRLWVTRSRTLEDFAVYTWGQSTVAVGTDDARARDTVHIAAVTPTFMKMLRVHPSLGRDLTKEDGRTGAAPVVLLSDALWRERFGGASSAIGSVITVNGVRRTVVGVVPPRVAAPDQTEAPPAVWIPANTDSAQGGGAFARLRPGVSPAAASRELDAILRSLPDTSDLQGQHAVARTAQDRVEPERRRSVEVLFAAACGLLLIACADVAGLLLMRGWSRRRELAIRQALGAGRGRLTRLLLSESLLLALPSGVLGVLVAWIALRPAALGYFANVRLDATMLGWTAAIAVLTVLLFGAGPALLAWERSLDNALRAGGPSGGAGRATGRAHTSLVIGQIALSLVFLAAAGVLARSFVALVNTPVGYEPKGLIEVSVQRTPPAKGGRPRRLTVAERASMIQALHATLAATPGVTEVAIGTLPLTRIGIGPSTVDGANGARASDVPIVPSASVSRDYFRVARISIVRGRNFDPDPAVAANEIIINETLARHLVPDRDALGTRLRFGDGAEVQWATVVGIAGDARIPGSRAPDFYKLQLYFPAIDARSSAGTFVLRTRVDPATLRPVLSRAVERAGVGATLKEIGTAEKTMEYAYRGPRYAMWLFGAFALLAVALAAMGLFGIVAFAVARRTREIGIRVALGADAAVLTRTIVGQSLRLVGVGCAIGLVGAYGAGRAMTAIVYGVSPTDPIALVAAIAMLAVVALGASVIPVRRALAVDPTETLRAE